MLNKDEIGIVHPGYAEYAYRWDYYMRSYMGAEEYRDGAYLRKYIAEDDAPGDQYLQRLRDTALQNHCKSVVETYRAFVFRNAPTRNYGNLIDNPFVQRFREDVDLRGNDMTAFMREVSDTVSIYGGAWVSVDRPSYKVDNAAQELELDIRAYATLYNPTNVMNWKYEKQINGKRKLSMLKVIDQRHQNHDTIMVWYPDRIEKYEVQKAHQYGEPHTLSVGQARYNMDKVEVNYSKILSHEVFENPVGYIPFIFISTDNSFHDGVGTSEIGDVADLQRSIYNKLSELYQTIRISSHPTLVKEPSTHASAGAGAIITVEEDTRVNPYLLQPTGASIDGIIKSIELDVDSIETISHLKAVRAKSGSPMSGVAMQTERQLLNAKLSDKATTLEKAEKKIWSMWFDWQDIQQDDEFDIYYEKAFDLRDKHADIELYKKALALVPHDIFQHYVHDEIARLIVDDEEDLDAIITGIAAGHEKMNMPVVEDNTSNEEE